MKQITITDFLTQEEIDRAAALWKELKDTGRFAATVDREIITPNMTRINTALGQENSSKYLAYAVEHVFTQLDQATPGNLWEFAEDNCQVCGAHIGAGVRWMHLGLCDTCKAAPKH